MIKKAISLLMNLISGTIGFTILAMVMVSISLFALWVKLFSIIYITMGIEMPNIYDKLFEYLVKAEESVNGK